MEKADSSHVTLDPAGDLLLVVNKAENQRTFRVSTKAMGLASPVWLVMLDPSGRFKEAQPENGEVVFPEDEPNALLLVLYVVHLQFQFIPDTLSFQELLNLAIVCDKYDTSRLIIPWFNFYWEKSFSKSTEDSGNEASLLIAWVFRDRSSFQRVATRLVQDSSLDDEGKLSLRTEDRGILEEYMPPGVMESILEIRSNAIEALRAVVTRFTNRLTSPTGVCKRGKPACDAVLYGSLVMPMKKAGVLLGLLGSDTIKMNLGKLWQLLYNTQFHTYHDPSSNYEVNGNHPYCNIIMDEWKNELVAARVLMPIDWGLDHFASPLK